MKTRAAGLIGILLILVVPTLGQDRAPDRMCAVCHDVETAHSAPVERTAAIHRDVACVDCHVVLKDFDPIEMEHELELEPVSCMPCHYEERDRMDASSHADLGMQCATCHGTHDVRAVLDADSPVSVGRSNALCARCHSDIADVRTNGGVHAIALAGRTCTACHDPHEAASPASIAEDLACLECHTELEPHDGGPSVFPTSVHGESQIRCVLCHTDMQDLETAPHWPGDSPRRVRCESCHVEEGAAHARGVHDGFSEEGRPAADCHDCHGSHDVHPVDDPRSRLYPLSIPDTCERCHSPERSPDHPEYIDEYETSVHGRALRKSGLIVTATCSSCHGSHEIHPVVDPSSSTSRRNVPYTCGACHAGVLSTYLEGVHGEDFLRGEKDVPVCTDCHGEHAIEDPALGASSVSHKLVAQTCARCHADDELAMRHGMSGSSLVSWGRSYHGIASEYGEEKAANCASCHGHHDIFASTDPRSAIHADNIGATCGSCHTGSDLAFSRVPVHSVVDADSNFIVWFVKTAYLWLIAAVIGGFLLFIAIDLFGRVRLRLGWGPEAPPPVDPELYPDEERLVAPTETFTRFGLSARIQHGILVLSFLLLVVTGVPLLLHEIPGLRAMLDFQGGFRLRSWLHRAGAIGLIGLSAWHVLAVLLLPSGRRWFRTMIFRPRDVLDFLQESMFHLGLLDWLSRRRWLAGFFDRHPALACRTRPHHDTYSLVEKLEYGAVLWGNLVMIATGTLLWRPGWFLGWMPAWAFDLGRVVHGYEATLAFLAIIVWHMYHVHLRPEVFPMSRIWLTGEITRNELRHHHTRKYLRILERRREAAREDGADVVLTPEGPPAPRATASSEPRRARAEDAS